MHLSVSGTSCRIFFYPLKSCSVTFEFGKEDTDKKKDWTYQTGPDFKITKKILVLTETVCSLVDNKLK